MTNIDFVYIDLMKKVIEEGNIKKDHRRDVFKKEIPSYYFSYNTLEHGIPILESKHVSVKNVIAELAFFITGNTNVSLLNANNCKIWNEDAYNFAKKNGEMREFMDSKEKAIEALEKGHNFSLGPVYGANWDSSGDLHDKINLENVMFDGKRIVFSHYQGHPADVALQACHHSFEILKKDRVDPKTREITNKFFDIKWNQRSVDLFLGLPYNILSYYALGKIIELLNPEWKLENVIGNLSNIHIYAPHTKAIKEQLSVFEKEKNKEVNKVLLKDGSVACLNRDTVLYSFGDQGYYQELLELMKGLFVLENYKPHGKITSEMIAHKI